MVHDPAMKIECERLYVDELYSANEVSEKTGVPVITIYRWRKEGKWDELREQSMDLRDKLRRLLFKLIEAQLEEDKNIEPQELYGLIKILEKFQKTGAVRERIVYVEDAERLFEVMKEMDVFRSLLEDQEVLAELGERLKEKSRQ